jgi:hypothetical protein
MNISVIQFTFSQSEVFIWITYWIISIDGNCWFKLAFFICNDFFPSFEEN